jgi:hypothetical protein
VSLQDTPEPATVEQTGIRRLNWGCGGHPVPGWINSDKADYPGVDIVADVRDGLPLENDSIDYAVSVHALPEIPYPDLVPTLEELRRVLKKGAFLRLVLPDLDRAIQAYRDGNAAYFLIPDEDARTLAGKLITQMLWYGWSRSMFTFQSTEELLLRAGYSRVVQCSYRETSSPFPPIVNLDSREQESFYVEAVK